MVHRVKEDALGRILLHVSSEVFMLYKSRRSWYERKDFEETTLGRLDFTSHGMAAYDRPAKHDSEIVVPRRICWLFL